MKVMTETATGRRTPSGVITSAMPAFGAGIDVDRVVADAEASDDGEPAAFRHAAGVEAMGQQDQRVEILELVGGQRIAGFQERHLDVRARRAAARDRNPDRSATRRAS